MAAVLLLKNANIYTPAPIGKADILCLEETIVKIGNINAETFLQLEIPVEIIDLEGAIVFPGMIDPHEHIIGGSGEKGYGSRSPEITVPEIVAGGITTLVGCIGVDTITRNMHSLLAQAKFFNDEGLTAYIWSGGYPVPPATLTGSIETDMILVHEVIGAGEIAISDYRSSEPSPNELAKLVVQGYNSGILTGKAGVTHFHLGEGKKGLLPLIDLLEQYDINLTSIYPTHVNRNAELLKQSAGVSQMGMTIDFDCCDGDLIPSLQSFQDHSGDFNFLTLSSDASYTSPLFMYQQMQDALKHFKWPLEKILPLVTTNTARILKLPKKGKIAVGADADFVCVDTGNFTIQHVIARGKFFIREGALVYNRKGLADSNRKIEIYGKKKLTR